jgi:GAF domain-containing protein
VLKALMSASELRSAQRAALLFFENPKAGPIYGLELLASWQSSHALPPWLSEFHLYEEPSLRELFQPSRPVVFLSTQADPRLSPKIRDLLLEGNVHSLAIFPLFASGVWLGCLFVFYEQEHEFNKTELRHLKVLVDQATITLYNLQLLEVEEELRREAERTTEIKTRFLAMISHELRTPLTSIKGFTDTLLAEDVAWEPHEQRFHPYHPARNQPARRADRSPAGPLAWKQACFPLRRPSFTLSASLKICCLSLTLDQRTKLLAPTGRTAAGAGRRQENRSGAG